MSLSRGIDIEEDTSCVSVKSPDFCDRMLHLLTYVLRWFTWKRFWSNLKAFYAKMLQRNLPFCQTTHCLLCYTPYLSLRIQASRSFTFSLSLLFYNYSVLSNLPNRLTIFASSHTLSEAPYPLLLYYKYRIHRTFTTVFLNLGGSLIIHFFMT